MKSALIGHASDLQLSYKRARSSVTNSFCQVDDLVDPSWGETLGPGMGVRYATGPGKPVVLGGPRSMTGVPARLANT
jgi:hypothetical protein